MTQIAPAGFFSPEINNSEASNKLPWFPAGFIGQCKIIACKGITVRAGGHRAFVVELEVLTSNMPDKVYVGGKYSWFQSLREAGTAYPSCISFLYAALGLDQQRDKAKIDKDVKPKQDSYLNAAVSDKNILGGTTVNLQTANKKLKDKVTDFTLHTFSAVAKAA